MPEYFLCAYEIDEDLIPKAIAAMRFGNRLTVDTHHLKSSSKHGALRSVLQTTCDSPEILKKVRSKAKHNIAERLGTLQIGKDRSNGVDIIVLDTPGPNLKLYRKKYQDGQTSIISTTDIAIGVLTKNDIVSSWGETDFWGSLIDTSHELKMPEAGYLEAERYVVDHMLLECERIAKLLSLDDNKSSHATTETQNIQTAKSELKTTHKCEKERFRDAVAFALWQFSQSDSPHKIESSDEIISHVNSISECQIDREEYNKVINNTFKLPPSELWDIVAYALKCSFGASRMKNKEIVKEAQRISGYKDRNNPANVPKRCETVEKEYRDCIRPASLLPPKKTKGAKK